MASGNGGDVHTGMYGTRVAVTGASGFIARNLRGHLSEIGAELTSISRSDFENMRHETKLVTENYDARRIMPKIRGCDALIHLAGIGQQSDGADYDTINTWLTEKVVGMCKSAGIRKMVYMSGLGVSEQTPLGYFISKLRAEKIIMRSGLDYTIFRPAHVVGNNDPLSTSLREQARQGAIKIPGSGRYVVQPVYIGDVVLVIAKSITAPPLCNKVIDLVGPKPITFAEYAALFSDVIGSSVEHVDLETAYRVAIRAKPIPHHGSSHGASLGLDDLNMLVGSFEGDYERLQRVSGIKFRSVQSLFESGLLP